ncbi:ABC transporter permease [Paramaledivibacter caminithermalis]|uniref:ABC-type nitrate/sulfonate/bicarbonate transport system, permease component n=1 Tax=Paramaledivibacter caminithermalis (strain DSM 15212 / CIP 107654 / DViRD3) TaxID=1121301 RepID=A0A1M6QYL8_PARC5|nr:ABC transporter permease [Paramaledivibacter caminithermalis]SHK25253.1 ABC-type nitrate/sulfonate/bicarbonate transport system, permease component [Paramaledivibacter caminithermalis DSM 15212]
MRKLGNIENRLIPIGFLGILIFIWHFAVESGIIKGFMLPSPIDVGTTLFKILPEIKPHIMVTLIEAFYGFILAIALAIFLAVLMDNISILKKALYPLIVISQTIPILVLAPLFAMWFGFGKLPKIIVVTLVCFFPLIVSLSEGFDSVDKDLLNLMKSMGASKLRIFTLVKFPASMVNFFTGLKVAATYCIMAAFIGEWMGGKEGLGLYMMRAKKSVRIDKVFAVVILVVILSMLLFKFVEVLQKSLMPWNNQSEQ